MISFLEGVLVSKSPTELIVDVNGVGYAVHIPLSTYEKVDGVGGRVKIYTHLHVREDAMQLYGFASEMERELFRLLISVSGIGPRIAQGILSGMESGELKQAIRSGNHSALTMIQGVGRKTAERIVVELRDKLGKMDESVPSAMGKGASPRSEALAALMSLGYSRASAESALRNVVQTSGDLPLEELIKHALRLAGK
jgi:Holliday junction DNA helicase RuvA